MGRPATTTTLCRDLHALALGAGILPGQRIPRHLWAELVARSADVSVAQERNITQTGELLGLWRRNRDGTRDFTVELHALAAAPVAA